MNLPTAYNAILGHPTLNRLSAVVSIVSTYHMGMKFPISQGVGEVRSDPVESRHCYLAFVSLPRKMTLTIQHFEYREDKRKLTQPHLEPVVAGSVVAA